MILGKFADYKQTLQPSFRNLDNFPFNTDLKTFASLCLDLPLKSCI